MESKRNKVTKKSKQDARNTLSGFVAWLYRNDLLISNQRALAAIKKKFPKSRTTARGLSAIRCRLRKEGLRIPYQRAGVGTRFKQNYIDGTSIPVLGDQDE